MGTTENETSPAQPVKTSHPKGFWFIFWGEFAERCSFYGMRAILGVYMSKHLGFGEDNALVFMSLFLAGVYFLPLLGGYIADNFFGKYWTIVGFCVPYIVGQLMVGIESKLFFFVSLVLLAMGSGVIKPNLSTLMGLTYDQQRPGQERLRSVAFAMFYMAINIGAAISQFCVPILKKEFSYQVAFMFPAALMVVAFIIFAAGKKYYAVEKIEYKHLTQEERHERWQVLLGLSGLFGMVIFFWAIFDQSTSTWIFFGNTYMNCHIFGYKLDPEQLQSLNPVLIVGGLPFVTWLWVYLDKKGVKVRATDKMFIGFLLTAVSMAFMTYAAYLAGPAEVQTIMKEGKEVTERVPLPPERQVTIWWQVGCYAAITMAELLISVTGLELAFVVAPKSMKGFVTAMWLAVVGIANFAINMPIGLLGLYTKLEPVVFFGVLTGISFVVAIGFIFVGRRFNKVMAERGKRAISSEGNIVE